MIRDLNVRSDSREIDPSALQDLYRVCEANRDEIAGAIDHLAREHWNLGRIVRMLAPEGGASEGGKLTSILQRAASGDWTGFERELGAAYPGSGLASADWNDLLRDLQRLMTRFLVSAYAQAPDRLFGAIDAMRALVERARATLAPDVVEDKKRLFAEQRSIAHEIDDPYEVFFNNSPLVMWISDVETLELLAVNQATIDRYGFSRSELLAMTLEDILASEDIAQLLATNRRLKEMTGSIRLGEQTHRHKDGSALLVELSIQHMIFGGRRVLLVIATNVTVRREATPGALAMMSHELRTPLNSIIGFSELLADPKHGRLTELQARYVQHVNESGHQLLGLINEALRRKA